MDAKPETALPVRRHAGREPRRSQPSGSARRLVPALEHPDLRRCGAGIQSPGGAAHLLRRLHRVSGRADLCGRTKLYLERPEPEVTTPPGVSRGETRGAPMRLLPSLICGGLAATALLIALEHASAQATQDVNGLGDAILQ